MHTDTIIVIALLLPLALAFFALVFSPVFRDSMLGAEGEASFFGLVTARGAAFVLVTTLLVGGALIASSRVPPEIHMVSCLPNSCVMPTGPVGEFACHCGLPRMSIEIESTP